MNLLQQIMIMHPMGSAKARLECTGMTETFQILMQSMAKKHQIMKMALMKSFIQAGWEMDMDFQLVMVVIKIFKQIITKV